MICTLGGGDTKQTGPAGIHVARVTMENIKYVMSSWFPTRAPLTGEPRDHPGPGLRVPDTVPASSTCGTRVYHNP